MNYHLFGGEECYYASGGASDFIGSFATLEEAEVFAFKCSVEKNESYLMWWHITDAAHSIIKMSKGLPHNDTNGACYKDWKEIAASIP